ncbi:MAG: DinB family protein [Chloroflexi bacterium]|nr:DinB family protein [Chloroflexota bacterium]
MAIKLTGIKNWAIYNLSSLLWERPARKTTITELITKLEQSGQAIATRAETAADTPANRELLRHISGIERWGQRRLRVFLGKAFIQDEYDSYQPAASLNLPQQREFFQKTRQATIELARQLATAKLNETATVRHNFFGPMSARAWLTYLAGHANREGKGLK